MRLLSPSHPKLVVGALLAATLLSVGLWTLAEIGRANAPIDESAVDDGQENASGYVTVHAERQDLVVSHEASGSVVAVASQAVSSPADGTVVKIVEPGAMVRTGDVLAVVDDRPVTAIAGTIPMWRDLEVGDVGADVEQLETALAALGFDPDGNVTIDTEYTFATAAMVTDWQEGSGQEESGSVRSFAVVVIAEPMTVASGDVSVGAIVREGDDLIQLDSLEQMVVASIPVADAISLSIGDAVDLRFPDRSTLPGVVHALTLGTDTTVRIAEISFFVDSVEDLDGNDAEQALTPSFEGVTVEISWDEVVAADALTVPADVFRHLDDGSYVLDVVNDDGTVTSFAVELGRHVGNLVEVAGLPVGASIIRP